MLPYKIILVVLRRRGVARLLYFLLMYARLRRGSRE